MVGSESAVGVRFGRTTLAAVTGELPGQGAEALVLAANTRGLLGAGSAGGIRLADAPELEREVMSRAPLELGAAVLTGPGRFADQGVAGIVHAVVSEALGAPTTLETIRRATVAALRVAEAARFRSLAVPAIGSGRGPGQLGVAVVAPALVEEVVAFLRRSSPRLVRVVFVSRSDEDAALFAAAITRARERSWEPRA